VVTTDTAHIGARIDRPAADVYAYIANPAHLPEWAHGLGGQATEEDGEWFVETPGGRIKVVLAPANYYGILDHDVTYPNGETYSNPVRVVPYGGASEIVFSVRRNPGTSDADFERDTSLVTADLVRLKEILESR
jgi:uncharacterized protein YndB with AHSA1/START domain